MNTNALRSPLRQPLRPELRAASGAMGGGLGPELLTNGDFSGGATGWSVTNQDGTHIVTFAGGTCRYQSDTTSPSLTVSQTGVMVVGRTYRIVTVISANAGSAGIKSDAFTPGNLVLANPAIGTYEAIGIAVSTSLSFTRNAVNADITIDSISVREIL